MDYLFIGTSLAKIVGLLGFVLGLMNYAVYAERRVSALMQDRLGPNRVGFAVPSEWRLSVTAYPDIRLGDAQETLLHELVHLHVGTERGQRRWHGRRFKRTLHRAMAEAYGLRLTLPRSALHGTYADALERLHARRLADANAARQLQLPLTG